MRPSAWIAQGGMLGMLAWLLAAGIVRAEQFGRNDAPPMAVLYVDDSSTAVGGDGLSWATAFKELQAALDAAPAHIPPGGWLEIHIGQGTYKPTHRIDPADPRSATFQCLSSVALMGGYAGVAPGAPNPDARDVNLYPTTLSGDLLGNDGPTGSFTNYDDKAYHVEITSGTDITCILDGLNITAGNACCGFEQFDPRGFGGGVQNLAGSPTLINCRITYCVGNRGGGFYNEQGNPSFFACTFSTNQAQGINREGAGLRSEGGSVSIMNCRFENGLAIRGGGVECEHGLATIVGCTFANNSVGEDGDGGGICGLFARIDVVSSWFQNNTSANDGGGAALLSGGAATLHCCTFVSNSALFAGGLSIYSTPTTISDCMFTSNHATTFGDGGGLRIDSSGASLVTRCQFTGNTAQGAGGGLDLATTPAGMTVTECLFENNSAAMTGGGAIAVGGGSPTISSCRFQGNIATSNGGAIRITLNNSSTSHPALVNCLFWNNRTIGSQLQRGGAVYSNGFGSAAFANCSFSGNIASPTGGGGGLYSVSPASLRNCVLWGNTPNQIAGGGSTVQYSDLQGGWSGLGDHNLSANPLFTNSASGDLTLSPGSPCIDSGDNLAVPAGISLDLSGNPRFRNDPSTPDTGNGQGAIVDRGCYEFQRTSPICPQDCAIPPNGVVDIDDLLAVIADWGHIGPGSTDVTGNGVVDIDDLLAVILAWGGCPQVIHN